MRSSIRRPGFSLALLASALAALGCRGESSTGHPVVGGSLVFTVMPESGGTPWIFAAPLPTLQPVRQFPTDTTASHALHAISPTGDMVIASLARFLASNADEEGSIPATYEYYAFPLVGSPPVRLQVPGHPENLISHWLADTTWVYFSATVEVPRTRRQDRFRADLFRIRYDGTRLSRVATDVSRAVFTRGRSGIAFLASANGTSELFTMQLDGSGRRRLTHFADSVSGVGMTRFDHAWIADGPIASPDGSLLAIAVSRRARPGLDASSDIYVMDTDTYRFRKLDTPQVAHVGFMGPWSPAGDRFLVYGNTPQEIYSVEVASGRTRHLPGRRAVWSPSGGHLLVLDDTGLYLTPSDSTTSERIAAFRPSAMLWGWR